MTSSVLNQPPRSTPPASAKAETSRKLPTLALVAPSVVVLLLWMIVPLAMAIWFAFQRYNLLVPDNREFAGFGNFTFILTDPALWISIWYYACSSRLCTADYDWPRNAAGGAVQSGVSRSGHRQSASDFTVLCDAHSERPDLEEYAELPAGEWAICADNPRARARSD